MGLFSADVELDAAIAPAVIGSESSNRKQITKIQDSLLRALLPGERLVWVSADVVHGGGVMALTDQRILYGGGKNVEYIVPGDRVARTALMVKEYASRQYPKVYAIKVTWFGGPLKHQTIKNFSLSNDFISIWRYEYDEANQLCLLTDRQFGLT
jgi:hypothetical protein